MKLMGTRSSGRESVPGLACRKAGWSPCMTVRRLMPNRAYRSSWESRSATLGSYGLSMQRVVIPPGGKCQPHSHIGSETALYVLSGHAVTYHGPGLTQRTDSGPGDFLYIAPGVPHCAYNLSDTEPVIAITARTDANDQERVAPYDIDAYYRQKAA